MKTLELQCGMSSAQDSAQSLKYAQLFVPRERFFRTRFLTTMLHEKLLSHGELDDADLAVLAVCRLYTPHDRLQIATKGTRREGIERQVASYLRHIVKLAEARGYHE